MARYAGLIERYRDRLPVSKDTRIVSLCEGDTPLIKLDRIPRKLGRGVEIYVKFEGLNPTGSFKDRALDHGLCQFAKRNLAFRDQHKTANTGARRVGCCRGRSIAS